MKHAIVSYQDIKDNNYSLNPKDYIFESKRLSTTKLNSSGTFRQVVDIDNIKGGAIIFYSYNTVIGMYHNKSETFLVCQNDWSQTTAKHLSKLRDMAQITKEDTYEPRAFQTAFIKLVGVPVARHYLKSGVGVWRESQINS